MPPTEGSLPAPSGGPVQRTLDRLRGTYAGLPLPLKILLVAVCCIVGFPVAILLAPYAVISGGRSIWATGSVAIVGIALVSALAHGAAAPHYALFFLPIAVAFAAHAGALGRCYAPCRTVAWVIPLALLPGIAVFRLLDGGTSFIGPGVAWFLAAVVLGWRLAKAWQDSRQAGTGQQVRGGGSVPGQLARPGPGGSAGGYSAGGQLRPSGQP